jgi:hypothetical protein
MEFQNQNFQETINMTSLKKPTQAVQFYTTVKNSHNKEVISTPTSKVQKQLDFPGQDPNFESSNRQEGSNRESMYKKYLSRTPTTVSNSKKLSVSRLVISREKSSKTFVSGKLLAANENSLTDNKKSSDTGMSIKTLEMQERELHQQIIE